MQHILFCFDKNKTNDKEDFYINVLSHQTVKAYKTAI